MAEVTRQAIMATNAERENEASADMQRIIRETNNYAKSTKGQLDKMKSEMDESVEEGASKKSNEDKMRENLYSALTRKFAETIGEYHRLQSSFKEERKKKFTRQLKIVEPNATEAEINDLFDGSSDSAETRNNVFQRKIMNAPHDSIRTAYAHVQDKLQSVIQLERDVQEMYQMQLDFATLIEQQGEMLDQIEEQVKASNNFLKQGNEQIDRSIVLQAELRKKKCCLIVMLLIVFVIIGFATGMFTPNSS